MKEIQEATVSLDNAKEICVNAALVAVLSELVRVLTLKETQKMTLKVFLSEKDDFTSLSTDFGVKSLRHYSFYGRKVARCLRLTFSHIVSVERCVFPSSVAVPRWTTLLLEVLQRFSMMISEPRQASGRFINIKAQKQFQQIS